MVRVHAVTLLGVGVAATIAGVACSSAEQVAEPVETQGAAVTSATGPGDFLPVPKTVAGPMMSGTSEFVPLSGVAQTTWNCSAAPTIVYNSLTDVAQCQVGASIDNPDAGGFVRGATAPQTLRGQAMAYLKYILGGDPVPTTTSARDKYWGESSRRTADRLCWLREGVKAGHVKVKNYGSATICADTVRAVHVQGTLAATYSACPAPNPDHPNPALHVARISRSARASFDFCGADDRIPTYFQISQYLGAGDNQALIDPEAAVISASWDSGAASAAATGQDTGAALTAYRFGAQFLASAGRTSWIGNPCIQSTATLPAGTVASKFVMYANPPSNTYIKCNDCGASGQSCCPNSAGTLTTCNTGLTCSSGKCG